MRPGRSRTHRDKPEETGAVYKPDRSLIRAALVYPNTYPVGMSNLGFQAVYHLVNRIGAVSCERVFLPQKKETDLSGVSVETGTPLDRFDIILFSVSFENDFNHLVHLLREAGIPPRSSDRNTIHPLVIAGGVACFLNPEPIADFIDCFLLGEAEQLIGPFFDRYLHHPDRYRLLETIEQELCGAYVPGRHTPVLWSGSEFPPPPPFRVRVQHVADLSHVCTMTRVLTADTAFGQKVLIETGRGCPHGCRFCSAGFIYRPPRFYPRSVITSSMDRAAQLSPQVGLVSSAVSNHQDINAICRHGWENNLTLSFSSLRADALTDALVASLAGSSVKTATIAPEAGSQRMRDIINKRLDEPAILSCVDRFVSAGIPNLRLYFMIGLPRETDADVQAIVDLTLKIKKTFLDAARKQKRIGTITLSINPFIPKPATPFQWAPMQTPIVLKRRLDIIRTGLKKTPNIRINTESLKQARINALLSRADRRAAGLIEAAVIRGWASVFKAHEDYCRTVIHTPHPPDTRFPWDFVDNGISPAFLLREYRRAEKEKTTPPCPMIPCGNCGICMA